MKLKSKFKSIFLLFLLAALPGIYNCGVYTFTGTTITAETLSIQNFYNDADQGPPNLAQDFTDKLRDYFQQNTNLTIIPENGELSMEGAVVNYRLSPLAPTSSNDPTQGDAAALTRLTITVQVAYVNITDPEFDFDKSFSFYSDFDSNLTLTTVEDQLIEEIFDQIILDIFNASVANW
jgi:hypothetical protein